ncbi:MAG: ABC transporter ATP-binding protein [Flavobacteriia bacterium]|nr:ABC transporter ATP-binding protein [Flavobacteriia bacterium]
MLELRNVHIGYQKPLFNTGEISLDKGQLISLFGKNGSGKSTFFSTLLGFQKSISGEIFFDHLPVQYDKRKEINSLFSYVNTEFKGLNFMTVFEYISLGRSRFTPLLGRLSEKDLKIIHEKVELLKIKHLLNKLTSNISDGERQLCSIAKALVQQAPIILLDEPTSFLDYYNKKLIMNLLKTLSLEENLLIIQANHDVHLCFDYSETIIWIDTNNRKLILENLINVENKQLLIESIFDFKR